MPDIALSDRKVAQPGSEFPKIEFRTQRVKATIVVIGEIVSPADEGRVRIAINDALRRLTGTDGIKAETSYERV